MRISLPASHERLGALRIHAPGHIVELDSVQPEPKVAVEGGVLHVGVPALEEAQRRLTIVVPVKDERRSTLRGVLTAIPGACRIVVISASKRSPIDRFELEREVIGTFAAITGRSVLHLHQSDPAIGDLVARTGFEELLDEDGVVRAGKGEAMLLGTMIADAMESDAVGFIDADNYVPGAVNEYVRIYAATMATAGSGHFMNRISWLSKPKIEDDRLVFNRWGRSTAVSNRALNEVLSHYLGEGTSIITTGNAGEHVMSMGLARIIRMSGSFAAETGQLVDLMEQFGGIIEPPGAAPAGIGRRFVDVYQTETINPHFHEDKGGEHVEAMRAISLGSIAHSPVCPPVVAERYGDGHPAPRRYRPIATLPTGIDPGRLGEIAAVAPPADAGRR